MIKTISQKADVMKFLVQSGVALLSIGLPGVVCAAGFDGAGLSLVWAVPFVGILLSIALLPLLAANFWHHHYGKISVAWTLAFFTPFAYFFGVDVAGVSLVHAMLAEYIPFIVLLTALYTVAGGIYIRGNLHGSPKLNCGLLLIGVILASFMGTTGASMLMIRPLIRANNNRLHKTHLVVFFIFLVSNVGGSLTPLGDPPLFLGFLKGVDFFWTARYIFYETLFMVASLLVIFYIIDSYYFKKEGVLPADATQDTGRLGFDGAGNFWLLAAAAGLVLTSGVWKSPVAIDVAGTMLGLPGMVRDVGLVIITLISLRMTAKSVYVSNQFSWAAMQEVAKLFIGIFLTIIPVIAMLQAGANGPFGAIVSGITRPDGSPDPAMYLWATGLLSAFLDNAPTYLVFFNTAGGDPKVLMTTLAPVLAAISAGAVFMGALTYIGNAPNLMVKSVAEDRGVEMPSFFGYMAWSFAVLTPLLIIVTLIWFR